MFVCFKEYSQLQLKLSKNTNEGSDFSGNARHLYTQIK